MLLTAPTSAAKATTTAKIIPNTNIIFSFLCFLNLLSYLLYLTSEEAFYACSIRAFSFENFLCSLLAAIDSEVHTCTCDNRECYNCYCHNTECHHTLCFLSQSFFNLSSISSSGLESISEVILFTNLLSFFLLFECKVNAFCVRTQIF